MSKTGEDPRRNDYRVLEALLAGKVVKGVVAAEAVGALGIDLDHSTIVGRLRKWEKDGSIVGYAPILSERGRRRFEALKVLYEDDGGVPEEASQ